MISNGAAKPPLLISVYESCGGVLVLKSSIAFRTMSRTLGQAVEMIGSAAGIAPDVLVLLVMHKLLTGGANSAQGAIPALVAHWVPASGRGTRHAKSGFASVPVANAFASALGWIRALGVCTQYWCRYCNRGM